MAKRRPLSQRTKLSPEKAGEMLKHGEAHGRPLSPAQKGFFGAVRGKKRGGKSKRPHV